MAESKSNWFARIYQSAFRKIAGICEPLSDQEVSWHFGMPGCRSRTLSRGHPTRSFLNCPPGIGFLRSNWSFIGGLRGGLRQTSNRAIAIATLELKLIIKSLFPYQRFQAYDRLELLLTNNTVSDRLSLL